MANLLRVFFALFLLSACETDQCARDPLISEDESTYPRNVIVHTAYDYGFSTLLADGADRQVFAEDEVLVAMVEEGKNVSDPEAFGARVLELGGRLEPDHVWVSLEVQFADGPYILVERGGNERIMERDGVDWW